MTRPLNLLVLCTGNSARSILLEAILAREGGGRISAHSAGSRPAGRVHPQALNLLAELGYATGGLRSKSWDEFSAPGAPVMDIVVTVCASAAGETCPIWPGRPLRAHWGIDDPAALAPDRQADAFRKTHDRLLRRARAFLALPMQDLTRPDLPDALARIGDLP
jgi:protein-tyrosine-phosphatase